VKALPGVVPIRVLVVDDHPLVREGLRAVLATHADIEVVGVASTAEMAVELASLHTPDVVLMDFRLAGRTGAEAAAEIRLAQPSTSIVFLSADDSDTTLSAAVQAGAAGYLDKSASMEEVVSAIRRAAAGEMLIPARVLVALLATERSRLSGVAADTSYGSSLTARERQVLQLTAEGVDSIGIAEQLFIELTTVRWHVRHILEKLQVHSKLAAVALAAEHGLVQRPALPTPHT
jgi:DNA-binding NarL/FixJ family response regulator